MADETRNPSPATPAGVGSRLGGGWPWLAALVTVASLFGPIRKSGIWDPHELGVADLARRIALTLLGGQGLALEDGVNEMPTVGELGRGQLPFTSVAVGFRLFGLHEWAGRLPLALWGTLGVLALFALVSRLADRVAGAFAALALATMPLYFLHARTILGDIVTMSSLMVAVAGLGLATFDDRLSAPKRLSIGLLGVLGLAAGYFSRGAAIGVAVPTLGVGLAWLVTRGLAPRDRLGAAIGVVSLASGAIWIWVTLRALGYAQAEPTKFFGALGALWAPPRQLPTFEAVIHYLGHGLFPWSAVLPLAIGRLLRAPPDSSGDELRRQIALRAVLVLVAACAYGVQGWLAPHVGLLPFAGVALLAGMIGVVFRDYDRGAPPSRAVAMGVAAFAILFYTDFKNFPEKGLSAFAVEGARFPESFKEEGTRIVKYGAVLFSGAFFLTWLERADGSIRAGFDEAKRYLKTLRTELGGNLWFALLVTQAALVGYALLAFLSSKYFHWKQFANMSPVAKQVASYGYLLFPLVVLALPPLAMIGRAVVQRVLDRVPVSRARLSLACAVCFAGVMSLHYYPALASQISPKEVFDAYQSLSKPGERLGILGVGAGSASYYAGRDAPSFSNAGQAFEWLMEGSDRRWLVTRASDLAQLNSSYRARKQPAENLPVLDARSSEILLVSSLLASGEKNANPFADWILSARPTPTRPLEHDLGGQLDVIGWDVTDRDGAPVAQVVPGRPYDFRIYYAVKAPISGNWETFIHIDGFQRRFNGDHKTLEGRYPLHLWRVGDFIQDIHGFTLEPNFTPGDYTVYFGLYIGNRRLEVKRGRHHEDRVEAGRLTVR